MFSSHQTGTLRKINNVVLPIAYSERFYKEVLEPSLDDVNKLGENSGALRWEQRHLPRTAACVTAHTSLLRRHPRRRVLLPRRERRPQAAGQADARDPDACVSTPGSARSLAADASVLAPYRSQGLGTALVRPATGTATRAQLTQAPPRKVINRAVVHVQVGNDEAKRFYERLGFKEDKVVDNYYARMEPRAAWLLVCDDIAAALGETAANGA
jgi:GNAT superfamily N-acetyltransferase